MTHFKNFYTSPAIVIFVAYVYMICVGIGLHTGGVYTNSDFFKWGVPVKFFGQNIEYQSDFYIFLGVVFVHQIINNYVNSVVYPWIINSVQDPKNIYMEYSKGSTLFLINLFNFYSQIDTIFIVMGFTSQISFVVVVSIANLITTTFINNKYIDKKSEMSDIIV